MTCQVDIPPMNGYERRAEKSNEPVIIPNTVAPEIRNVDIFHDTEIYPADIRNSDEGRGWHLFE